MTPGERVNIVKRIADRLSAESWADIDLILDQFGFPTQWEWRGDERSYVVACIKDASDSSLTSLANYLMGHATPSEDPWEPGRFRLFISHLASQKLVAHELKSLLGFYGIDGFVAHEDIQPGKGWQLVIESALSSCDALVALLHDGFRESDWCDQEVGFALGRGVPVVPIQFDLYPYGFAGSVQAIRNAGALQPRDLARELHSILLGDKRTGDKMTEGLVERLASASSFDQANRLSSILARDDVSVTAEQVERLRTAAKTNVELQGAWHFASNIDAIETRLNLAGLAAPSDDEEPF